MSVACDKFGFFNGIMGIEQGNWANFFRGVIPDGIIAEQANELEVYAQGDGMKVYVKTGKAMIDNHAVWVNTLKELPIGAASGTERTDLVVCRIVYGNEGESTAVLDVKANATAADVTQVSGGTYEIPLAEVTVGAAAVSIAASAVADRRHVIGWPNNIRTFSASPVSPLPDRIHRCTTELDALTIDLPQDPQDDFITEVRFPSSASFSAVTVTRGGTTISGTSGLKLKGDTLTLKSRVYTLVFWWDGSVYWCASAAAA